MIGKLMELAHKYMTIPYSRDTGNTPTRAATTGTATASAKPSEPTPKRQRLGSRQTASIF